MEMNEWIDSRMAGWTDRRSMEALTVSTRPPSSSISFEAQIWSARKKKKLVGMNELEKSVAMSMLPPDKNDKSTHTHTHTRQIKIPEEKGDP